MEKNDYRSELSGGEGITINVGERGGTSWVTVGGGRRIGRVW